MAPPIASDALDEIPSINTLIPPFFCDKIVPLVLGTKISAKYSYPWDRLFEVEIELN